MYVAMALCAHPLEKAALLKFRRDGCTEPHGTRLRENEDEKR